MIQVQSFVFNPFQEVTFVLSDETKSCIIIDPGCYEDIERQELTAYIENNGLKVEKLINTHCHIDHVLGNAFVKRKYGVSLYAHRIEVPYLKAVETYAGNYGFPAYESSEIDHFVDEGEKINFGNSSLDIVFVPGHSAGHIALISHDDKFCIAGDVLFNQSIGRTDLPGGDFNTLIESIHQKLFVLSDDFVVYCGHGPSTTIGQEKTSNPFCGIQAKL